MAMIFFHCLHDFNPHLLILVAAQFVGETSPPKKMVDVSPTYRNLPSQKWICAGLVASAKPLRI